MRHLPLRATGGLSQTLHIKSILDEDAHNDGDDGKVLLVTSASRGMSENMFTNASSSVFITSLTHNISTTMRLHIIWPARAVRKIIICAPDIIILCSTLALMCHGSNETDNAVK